MLSNRKGRLAIFLPIANFLWIAFFLSDYSNVWVQPEVNAWRSFLSESYTVRGAFQMALNWTLFEGEPRLTRPLANTVEMLDGALRRKLWRVMTPYPTLSLTYLFILVLTPLLLYAVLRSLGVRPFFSYCAVALYFANPGTLSLL